MHGLDPLLVHLEVHAEAEVIRVRAGERLDHLAIGALAARDRALVPVLRVGDVDAERALARREHRALRLGLSSSRCDVRKSDSQSSDVAGYTLPMRLRLPASASLSNLSSQLCVSLNGMTLPRPVAVS